MATKTIETYDRNGNLTGSRVVQVPEPTLEEVNRADLVTKAVAALGVNNTYLALTNPTNAQNAAQVQRLTRECSGLIRLLLGRLEDTTGT